MYKDEWISSKQFLERNFMKKIILLSVACLLVGCRSLEATSTKLDEKWVGHSYDEFVMEHGIAKASQQLQNGTTMYLWEESALIHTLGGKPAGSATCKLNILVRPNNVIQKVKASGSPEACYEIF